MSFLEAEDLYLSSVGSPFESNEINLFDLNWYDILIPNIAIYLSLKDLFTLRCCSQMSKVFAETALEHRKRIDLSGSLNPNIKVAVAVLGRYCRRLQELYFARCYWLTDDLLLPILIQNVRLQVINLNYCVSLTIQAIQPIIIECKELKVLKLSRCHWLTTGALDALTLHHSNLTEFDISSSGNLGERCLVTFFRKLNKLNILSLANSPSVTDQVVMEIGKHCRDLQHIDLVGCTAVSDVGIRVLTTSCKQLQSLMVNRCPLISEEVLAPLRRTLNIDRHPLSYRYLQLPNLLFLQV